ncbi:MAG: sodium:alanine symporter family protein [Acidobacteria bacterium]|jgi:AGCS family alanine or glycine:cation symporter|nr:sodium:alanine symporter family protein [Acidobacteriota bacterium]
MADAIQGLADLLFMPYIVAILLGTGLFLTIRFNVVQVRRIREAFRAMVTRQVGTGVGALSPFQAFMTALAASIGTGNIAGVAAAIISGGPGALFWIWVYGFLATSIKFSEAVLGVKFREQVGDEVRTGPMYYLRDGLKSPSLAWIYALVAGVAALTTTPFTQPNSIAVAMGHVFPSGDIVLPMLGTVSRTAFFTGLVLAVMTWAVIIGGIKSIGKAVEKLSPLKVGLYLLGGSVVIITFIDRLPYVLSMVVDEAFTMRSAMGFGIFTAMRYGIARGIYANEAGYGTAAVAYGTARSDRPSQQGLQAVMEVFIVSFVTGTISAMAILLSGVAETSIAARAAGGEFLTSTAAVASAFNMAIPEVGGWVVAVCAFLFGYTTLIGWAYYGEQFLEYILGRAVTMPYRYIYCLLIPFGAVMRPELVWAWGDLMNGLQVFPNIIGLIGLSGVAAVYARGKT